MSRRSRIKGPDSEAALLSLLLRQGRPFASFHRGDRVRGATGMALRSGYSYVLDAAPGALDPGTGFEPELTPAEMLALGVFEGKYLNDCISEFPAEWFLGALTLGRLSPQGPDVERCNCFGVRSRQPLSVWRENGWAPSRRPPATDHYGGVLSHVASNPDERGWFQWYCRYWMGRRLPEVDRIQIARWRSFRRHAGSVRAGCRPGDLRCYPRERQALLQWAYNPFI
jgi:hypothetical protein